MSLSHLRDYSNFLSFSSENALQNGKTCYNKTIKSRKRLHYVCEGGKHD